MCDILLIEAFYDGSHRSLIDLLHENLFPRSMLITLPGTKWPWRARCSSLILSELIPENENNTFKYLFSSSIVNLSELISLRIDLRSLKKIIYFHENDLVYPKQNENQEQRDFQYGYNQILTALVADICLFNSFYNLNTFLDKLGPFLNRIPSPKPNIQQIRKTIENKSKVFYYPLNKLLTPLNVNLDKTGPLCIIWPHRWEHDKDPETFFSVIFELYQIHSLKFSLIILGQSYGETPSIFSEILSKLPSNYIRHWGFAQSKSEYEQLLMEGDVVVSTAQHEFFGVAMLEACRVGCIPIVPDCLAYTELYPNEQHRYRTRTQLLNKLKEYCQKLDYVRTKAPKQDTYQFEWDRNENIRQQYLQLFQEK
jgi:glycosyltransferase involved in cell wall biosynthesis